MAEPAEIAGSSRAAATVALLSDTHIAASADQVQNEQNMTANLQAVVRDVLARPGAPSCVVVNGDLALKNGQPGDYEQLLTLLQPLHDAGVPLHLGLGNHDDRNHFRQVLGQRVPAPATPEARHVSEIVLTLSESPAPSLRILLLDSLMHVDQVPGLLGPEQLVWVQDRLDDATHQAVPTIVVVHHNPSSAPGTLIDTEALLRVLGPRKQAKALVFGHTHTWSIEQQADDGLWLVNLPAVGYPFAADQPVGWVALSPTATGAQLTLHAVGGNRARDGETRDLAWR